MWVAVWIGDEPTRAIGVYYTEKRAKKAFIRYLMNKLTNAKWKKVFKYLENKYKVKLQTKYDLYKAFFGHIHEDDEHLQNLQDELMELVGSWIDKAQIGELYDFRLLPNWESKHLYEFLYAIQHGIEGDIID